MDPRRPIPSGINQPAANLFARASTMPPPPPYTPPSPAVAAQMLQNQWLAFHSEDPANNDDYYDDDAEEEEDGADSPESYNDNDSHKIAINARTYINGHANSVQADNVVLGARIAAHIVQVLKTADIGAASSGGYPRHRRLRPIRLEIDMSTHINGSRNVLISPAARLKAVAAVAAQQQARRTTATVDAAAGSTAAQKRSGDEEVENSDRAKRVRTE